MVEARTVLQVREARCCMVENRFRIAEAHGVMAFLPSSQSNTSFLFKTIGLLLQIRLCAVRNVLFN